uniref:Growth-regulating factor n=1 Tax=Zea mays TaxID=4577 RepID=A5HEG8_MAIZE|nr:putative growth-regulating factor 9 [Zea mays]
MMMMSGRAATAGRYPFTASQWQELEHQALIYKCLASGKPIPSYLMPPLRRILDSALATSPSLAAFQPQPSLGWGGCFGMGFSRKPADEDPEPGRCRRTDGKKWRCSKEAYPDSKYCEKHMHRGKNRSRKPVEMSLATPAPPASSAATTSTSPAPSYHRPAPAAHDAVPYHAPYGAAYHHTQTQVMSPFHLHLETTHPHPPPPPPYYYADQRDYAYGKEVGERAFFSDGAGERDRQQQAAGQWQFKQLGTMEATKPCPTPTPLLPAAGYGVGQAKEDEEEETRRQQQQHCFVLGADLRLAERPSGAHDDAAQKPLRHFFDEWPHEKGSKAGWWIGGLDGETTQLSMSIPMAAAADLPVTSRYRT